MDQAVNIDRWQSWERYMNLLRLLAPSLLFCGLLLALPFLSGKGGPLYSAASGLYMELGGFGSMLATFSLCLLAWSIMYTQGLLVGLVVLRSHTFGLLAEIPLADFLDVDFQPDVDRSGGYLPSWAWRFFNTRVQPSQLAYYTTFTLPTLYALIGYGSFKWKAVLGCVLGGLLAYVVFLVALVPGFLAREKVEGQFYGAPGLNQLVSITGLKGARPLFRFRVWVSTRWLIRWFVARTGFEPGSPMLLDHFAAMLIFAALMAALWITSLWFHPLGGPVWKGYRAPALSYLHWLFCLIVWLSTALRFYGTLACRFPLPVVLAFVSLLGIGQVIHPRVHAFECQVIAQSQDSPKLDLSPAAVAKANLRYLPPKAPRNLVIITSTGGGIQAAGWTTYSLTKLIGAREVIAKEIRLLSTVSGGSVGSAFYLHSPTVLKDRADTYSTPRLVAKHAFEASTKSSLEAVAWGMVSRDFWRIPFMNFLPSDPKTDRGRLMEQAWRINSTTGRKTPPTKDGSLKFSELRELIAKGEIPGFFFNASSLEEGQRVVVTPLDMGTKFPRARSLSERITGSPRGSTLDMDLFTAARLSATFPFVSPFTRAECGSMKEATHHLGDGGYVENYGVASALEWLQEVLEDQHNLEEGARFERILIIQLRAFPASACPPDSESGTMAGVIGPIEVLMAARDGNALERNEAELARFISQWREAMGNKVQIGTVVFAPKQLPQAVPLSWRLTETQIEDLKNGWDDRDKALAQAVADFLNGDRCIRELEAIGK